MPRRLRLRADIFLLSVTFSIFLLSLSPFWSCIFSRRGFSRPTPRRPTHLPSPERIWCLLTGSSPSSRFPRRYASVGAVTVGTNGLTCGFKLQRTARRHRLRRWLVTTRLGSLPSPRFHGLGPSRNWLTAEESRRQERNLWASTRFAPEMEDGWCGTAEPTSRPKYKARTGTGKGGIIDKSQKEEEVLGAQTEAARQSRSAPSTTKRNEELSTCA